jgi:hypothetical protein
VQEVLLSRLQDQVELRLQRGASLVAVDAELIERAPGLSDDDKAALWLYAWSYRSDAARAAERPWRSVSG